MRSTRTGYTKEVTLYQLDQWINTYGHNLHNNFSFKATGV